MPLRGGHVQLFSFFTIRVDTVIATVIHSWVAMVKSISAPPPTPHPHSAAAECISLMRCLQPVCRAAARSTERNQEKKLHTANSRWLFLRCEGLIVAFRPLEHQTKGLGSWAFTVEDSRYRFPSLCQVYLCCRCCSPHRSCMAALCVALQSMFLQLLCI